MRSGRSREKCGARIRGSGAFLLGNSYGSFGRGNRTFIIVRRVLILFALIIGVLMTNAQALDYISITVNFGVSVRPSHLDIE